MTQNTPQLKAQLYIQRWHKEQKLSKELDEADRAHDLAYNQLETARKSLASTVGSNAPDKLFRTDGGDFVDVHYIDVDHARINVRTLEPVGD